MFSRLCSREAGNVVQIMGVEKSSIFGEIREFRFLRSNFIKKTAVIYYLIVYVLWTLIHCQACIGYSHTVVLELPNVRLFESKLVHYPLQYAIDIFGSFKEFL